MHEDTRKILDAIAASTKATIEAQEFNHAQHQRTRVLIRDLFTAVNQRFDSIEQQEIKIMAEIDDLNAKVDQLNTAVGTFDGVLQAAVTAIQTEIAQLVAMAQAATDLAALKAGVVAVTDRLTPAVDGIGTASATLQTQVDALASDDPAAPSV